MTSSPSIGRRLGISFAILALSLFGSVTLFEYMAFDRELDRIDSREIEGTVLVVSHLIDDTRAEPDLAVLQHRLDDARLGHRGLYVWLVGPKGEILYGEAPVPVSTQQASSGYISPTMMFRNQEGRAVRGAMRELPAESGSRIRKMVLTIDNDDQARLRNSLASTLVLALVAGTITATVLGLWLSRRALRPLRQISAKANTLSVTTIGARLPEQGVDAEISDLVASFNRALARIEAALRQQEAFSADVAHELNTPLATLIAGNEVALATGASEAELRDQLADNLDELHRLERIVSDMLFLARADQGEQARASPVSSIAAIALNVLDYHEAAIAEAGLAVRVDGDAKADVDESLLKRAISNLLSNATRFAQADTEIGIKILDQGEFVSLAVVNMGATIPADVVPRLFDRFFRAEPSRSESDRHHGLGLAIVAAIARMHSGRPFAESHLGTTTIGLILPRLRLDG